MPLIEVDKPFRFAIGGNTVIEYSKGVHIASSEVANVAIEQLKFAKEIKSDDAIEILPPIVADVNGNPLGDEIRHLDLELVAEFSSLWESDEKESE